MSANGCTAFNLFLLHYSPVDGLECLHGLCALHGLGLLDELGLLEVLLGRERALAEGALEEVARPLQRVEKLRIN